MVDFPGPGLSGPIERMIADWHVGGVVLFRKNVASPGQVADLTASLQRTARGAGAPPLWVAIDHEGGAVNRFAPGAGALPSASPPQRAGAGAHPSVTQFPSAMALGAAGDPTLAREAGAAAGRELRALGINLNFAPVMDVNCNPANPVIGARAFGESTALVEAMGLAYIEGLQSAGVAAVAKHFPGHGDVTVDSHLALPLVPHNTARLEAVEIPPFFAAVRAGVAAVMSAHIVYPALDPSGVPATMSAPILTGILRGRWGYRGIVCSDSLSMRAIADHYGAGDAAVAAVRAGCDLVLALGPEALQAEVLERLARAIETGEVPGARVADALGRLESPAVPWVAARTGHTPSGGQADHGAHADLARRIAEAAVTLVRDQWGLVPLRTGRIGVVVVTTSGAGPGDEAYPDLAAALRQYHPAVVEMAAGVRSHQVECVVAVTYTRGAPPAAVVEALRSLLPQAGDRLIVVAAGDPYDLQQFPDVPTYLATYGPDAPSMDAAARVLLGFVQPRGRLPVTLPGLYPAGHGLGERHADG
jgi:beta-N-acetylhexosaminidase